MVRSSNPGSRMSPHVVLSVLFAANCCFESFASYRCKSTLQLGPVTAPAQKGFVLDDSTFFWCADRIPVVWPHTFEPVTSLRLWRVVDNSHYVRPYAAWDQIVAFAHANNAKLLVSTQISCDEKNDDVDWWLVKKFLVKVGADHVMGVSIGNQLDQYSNLGWPKSQECIDKIWAQRYFIDKTISRIAELDQLPGFANVTVTSAFSAYALAGVGDVPFVNEPNATVNDYLTEVYQRYGPRFAFTFNIYSYFDVNNHLDPGQLHQCNAALKMSTCMGKGCLISYIGISARQKIQKLTGNPDDTFWLGETGWSTPAAKNLDNPAMRNCTAYSQESSYKAFYQNYLTWDLVMDGEHRGPDHVFYYAMRDSGDQQYFGLVESCDAAECKMQQQREGAELVVV